MELYFAIKLIGELIGLSGATVLIVILIISNLKKHR